MKQLNNRQKMFVGPRGSIQKNLARADRIRKKLAGQWRKKTKRRKKNQ